REQLWRYYPQALELGDDLAADWFLDLWALAPTPAKAARLRESRVAGLLKAHRIRRIDATEVLRILRQKPLDAIGTQKAIAEKQADYVLALKENQGSLHADVADFFADPALAGPCLTHRQIESGHGRIEERVARAADAAWLAERHPQWPGLRSIAAITAVRTDKKSGATSTETRLYISSPPPDPARLLAASRWHWSIENNLHWQLDVTFREDDCRTRKDHAACPRAGSQARARGAEDDRGELSPRLMKLAIE